MESDYRVLWDLSGGKSPTHWVFHSIESLLRDSKSISVGVMYPGGSNETGIPLIRVADVKDGRVVNKPDYLISDKVDEEYKRTRLDGSELLITLVGNPGDCVVVSDYMKGWNVARALAVVRLDDPSIREWLRYVLLSPPAMHQIDSRLNTTVQRTLNLKDIREIGVPLPPKKERDAITNALNTLDDKIELNRQMNQTLEAMAQALFKSWFVDFDPVIDNALAAGNAIPDAFAECAEQRKAVEKKDNSEIQDLFPDEFEFTEEMGWIPKEWEVSNVGTEFDVTMGQSPPGSTYNELEEGIYFFQGSTDFGFRYPTPRIYCTEPKRLANKRDTLVSVRAPVGDTNLAAVDCCIGRGLAALRHKSGSASFTYYAMLQLKENFKIYEGEGTVFGSINQKDFKNLIQLKLPEILISEFEVNAGALDSKIELNSLNIIALAKLRDTLLPKLMSGELRIPDDIL